MKHLITKPVLERAAGIRSGFISAQPFKHACIEDFLEPQWAETLLREFPSFDPKKAVDEFGKVGRKAVRTDMREISDSYRAFYDYISSPEFLGTMSEMTGIPELRFDSQMYGGGTHENLEGQALDAHVDFNYDQERKLHRRINLLVYLNKEWDVAWGGAIQLHSDPRDWDRDQVETYNCTFNRCVIFETNERSWHGFKRIKLPEAKHGLTRKCISIYLYTLERPQEEIVPVHGTFYVQDPLSGRFAPGYALREEDLQELKQSLTERDDWIRFYRRMEQEMGGENRGLQAYAESLALHAWTASLPIGARLRRLAGKGASAWLLMKRRLAGDAAPSQPMTLSGPPDTLTQGHVLDETDVQGLKRLLMARDRSIQRYQRLELELRRKSDALHGRIASLLASVRLPLAAGLRQEKESVRGAYAGGWVSSKVSVRLKTAAASGGLTIGGWLPEVYPKGMQIEASIDGIVAGRFTPRPGELFEFKVEPQKGLAGPFALEIRTTAPGPLPVMNGDMRDLAFVLKSIRALPGSG